MVGTAGDSVFRENRQGIRGTDDRIFTLEVSDNYGQSWSDVTEGLQRAVPDNLRSNLVISNKVDPFAHVRVATAWSSVPGGRTVFLGLGKAGLYRGRFLWTAKGPRVVAPLVSPRSVVEGDDNVDVKVSVVASPRSGPMRKVYADLSSFGLPDLELYDDGQHGDGEAGDKVYANHFVAPHGLVAGDRVIGVVAEDAADRMSSTEMHLLVASPTGRLTVWDGDQFTGGFGWVSPKQPLISFGAQTDEVHAGKVAMELHAEGSGAISGGWNWHGFYPADSGDDVTAYRNLTFWMKVDGESKPDGIKVSVVGNDAKASTPVDVTAYVQSLMDGAWHDVVIPLRDTITPDSGFNAAKVWMLDIDTWSATPRNFSVYLDDVGFDNRHVRSMNELISQAVPRAGTPVGGTAAVVTAQVDITSPGTVISPYIYGAASGDRKAANEMGLVSLRSGGNEATPVNWKHGYSSKGNDWFFQNYGDETPPEKNSLVTFFGDNKKAGLDSYLTMPMMGRVAKDGTSFAFDIRKYPDQESWAGKVQPGDRLANAGNGKQFVKGPDGQTLKDKNGKPIVHDIEANPDDTSVEMSPEEQTQMLAFMVKNMGYNTADQGGLKYIALDNEPMLWDSTHQGMHPKGTSYDELWDRTRTYASLLKKIDPKVQIAGPTSWGWTGYFLSGLDTQLVGQGKGTWDNPPDKAAHGGVPLAEWYLKKLNDYKKQTGQSLVDILDFHFYPQTGIFNGGSPNDPKTMESRVQETRVLWDPTWTDPSWMADDANGKKVGGHLEIIPLMKRLIAQNNPGMKTAIGEYNFGGEGDVSGGVAEAELLGVFAREGLDHAYYWFFPAPNSSLYFAFKLYRNPDGQHTVFGDHYLPTTVSAPDDVSVHAAKDSKTGRLTFVLVNKRAAKMARVTLNLTAPVPAQEVTPFEY
ncbi:MAG: glycoside hydrolase family 44 protein, partial [Armatimonadota bacterium]|nr:glycoside hydrolase family 44 protein [Armatimonadota bacterium]